MVFMEQLGAIILLFLLVMCGLLAFKPINDFVSKKLLKRNLALNKKSVDGLFIGLVSGSLVYILAFKVNVWIVNLVIFWLIVVLYGFQPEK